MRIFIWFLLVFSVSCKLAAGTCHAAFDLGSGQLKMTVAVVDEVTGLPLQILYSKETVLLLGNDLKKSRDGCLSEEILRAAEDILSEYRTIALSLGATKLCGIATAVFRESKNGAAFIEKVRSKIGINVHLISQEMEGRIGFLTAASASGKAASEIISWDSGGASFQIATENNGDLSIYQGPWGTSKVLAAMVQEVHGKDFRKIQTANPSSIEDIVRLKAIVQRALPPAPIDFNKEVVAIGGPSCIFKMAEIALGKYSYTKEEVWSALEQFTGKTDAELAARFPECEMLIARLTLLYSVMEHFGISLSLIHI